MSVLPSAAAESAEGGSGAAAQSPSPAEGRETEVRSLPAQAEVPAAFSGKTAAGSAQSEADSALDSWPETADGGEVSDQPQPAQEERGNGGAGQQPAQEEGEYIKAPLVGTFYTAAGPESEPFVKVGDQVKKGQTVCILEAMKMMSEIPAPMDCVIEEVLLENGSLAGYDAPLFRVRRV